MVETLSESPIAQNATPAERRTTKKALVAAIIGNALEIYDFTVYAIYAVIIGRLFFPLQSEFGQLLLSVSVFGIGFIMRPLGAIVLGAYADRAGRKAALTLTILMMALGTGMLAITPTYEAIGIAAPFIVVAARLLQGFSAGGELGAATTFLLEMAPPKQRGYFASWQSASQGLAIFVAGLIGYILSVSLTPEALNSWGWRLAFLVGLLIAPVGLYIRSQVDETMDLSAAHTTSLAVIRNLFRDHWYDVLICTGMITGGTISVYIVSNYMTTYAVTALHLPTSTGMLATLTAGIFGLFAAVAGGILSDRYGRRLLMIAPLVALILAIYPAFLIITKFGTMWALVSMVAVLTTLRAMGSAVVLVKLAEGFPAAIRSSGVALAYALGVTIFGGSAQSIITWLIRVTGDPMAPSWYLIAANVVTLISILLLREHKNQIGAAP